MGMKITMSEYEELKRKAALADAARERAGGDSQQESDEVKSLREEIERLKAAERGEKIRAARVEFENFIAEDARRQNKEHFGSKLGKYALEEIEAAAKSKLTDAMIEDAVNDPVDGKPRLVNELKRIVNEAIKNKMRVIEEAEASVARDQIVTATRFPEVRANALSAVRREVGTLNEEAYGSDEAAQLYNVKNRVRDYLLSKIFRKPVVNALGRHVLEEFNPMLHELIACQHAYEDMMGSSDGHWLSRRGRLFEVLNSQAARQNIAKLMEADEATTTLMVGGTSISYLPVDASAAIIMATWPRLIAARIAASSGVMNSNWKRIYDLQYPHSDTDPYRRGKHFFGAVDSDTPDTFDTSKTLADGTNASDEGALSRSSNHYPQNVFAYVGEVVDADTTITITGTDQNGDTTATASVTILTTDAVGTIKLFVPTVLGTKFMDVTAVTSSGWTDAAGKGEVGIFTPDPIVGHSAGSPAQKAYFKLEPFDVSEKSYDLQSNMPLSVIEDMTKALSAGGNAGLDLVATMIRMLSNELLSLIDSAIFDQAIQNAYASNQITFDTTTAAAGYSVAEWKEQVHYNFDQVVATVEHFSGARPNWMVWHSLDRPHIVEWLKGTGFLTTFAPEVNDPFSDGRARYQLCGCDVYESQNTALKRVLFGSNNRDTGVHYWTYVPFQILQGANPTAGFEQVIMIHHRAFIGVPTKTGVPSSGQKSLGVLKITR